MDEPSTSALQYGHLGKAVYVPETQSWTFSRTLTQPSLISYTGAIKTTVASPLTAPQSSLIENKGLLPRAHPELAAGWSLVSNETFSHVITTTSEICDPQVSSLLDLGYAVDFENDDSGSRVVPIAVFASGECGSSISFRRIEEDILELGQQTTRMRVPSIGDVEAAEWPAGGAPVRQICFARTVEEKATWMAARFPDSTTIFRPIYHRDPVPMYIYRGNDCVRSNGEHNSRLDANPLVEISSLQTGGFAHADVTFNPWYQKQLAIVDQKGNWSIWEISGRNRQSKGNWAAACAKTGSLPWLDSGDSLDLDSKPRHDGWATIEWAGDVNSFVVSDRRCPILYRMESDQIWSIPIELGLKRKSEWILDIKRSSSNVSHLFILTTTRIFWLEITPSPDFLRENTEPPLYPRLSWRHFRDPEDTTLQLSSLLTKEDFYLFLYSRLNHLVLGFQCPNASEEEMNHTITVPDPFILDVPSMVDVPTESQISPNSAQFFTFVFREIAHSPASSGLKYYDPNMRLAKLFLLDSRLAVRESVYSGPVAADNDAEEPSLGREVLRLKKRHGARKSRASRYRDDFIVDDWDESVTGMDTFTIPHTGISTVTPRAIPQWTTDYTAVYAVTTGKLMAAPRDGAGQHSEERIKETLNALGDRMTNTTLSDGPASETILEILGSSPLLDDIDQNARAIEDIIFLCKHRSSASQSEYQFMVLPSVLGKEEEAGKLNLIYTYDRLVGDWLSDLPHDIPGRTRITKERIIRRLAADLILGRINITRTVPNGANGPHPNEQFTRQDDAESSNPETGADFHKAMTPRPPSVPASEIGGNDTTSRSDLAATPLYSSLSSLTTFKIQPSMSRNAETILSHWVPGMNPATYDWRRTVYSVEGEESQQTSRAATPKRRQRKRTPQGIGVSSPAPRPVSPAVPAIHGWGSQPTGGGPPRGTLQSSQVTAMEEDIPMTQLERGVFGGREASRKSAAKARKKKRAAGF